MWREGFLLFLWMTAIQTASIESEIQTFSRDYYIQLSTAAAECGSNFLPNIIVSNEKNVSDIYITISTFTYFSPSGINPSITLPIPVVVSQNVTNKGCFQRLLLNVVAILC